MTWDSAFDVSFHTETIAIVGVSNRPRRNHAGFNRLTSFCKIRELGFKGRSYPINPKKSLRGGLDTARILWHIKR